MAEKINYYEWLELPIEEFECNPTKLLEALESKKLEWLSRKSISMQNRANIHANKIGAVMNNPEEWRRIYDEYVESVKERIADTLNLYNANERAIRIAQIASNNNVSEVFVSQVAEERKIEIRIVVSLTTPKPDFKLEDLKPKDCLTIESLNKVIIELGSADLMELLQLPGFAGVTITDSSDNDKVMEAITVMKKKWDPVPRAGAKGTQKSHVDKVVSGVTKLLASNPFSVYIDYLRYIKVRNQLAYIKDMLVTNNITELSETSFSYCAHLIYKIIRDYDKARSIFENYCKEENIFYPVIR